MNFTVINRELHVGNIQMIAVSSSGLFIVGDAHTFILSSILDSPPESLIAGPFVPPVLGLPTGSTG